VKRCRNSLLVLGIVALSGCGASKERRELEKLEAAIGMIASAAPEDRSIRLEQLQNLRVETEKVKDLKELCLSSYTVFDKASSLLAKAKKSTGTIEAEIEKAKQKQASGQNLAPEEEQRLLLMSARAAVSIESVTKELNRAEALVASCEKKRLSLRIEIMSK
jgi:hypothetical protein